MKSLLRFKELGPILALLVIAGGAHYLSGGKFFTPNALSGVTSSAAAIVTTGVGVTFLMISGEFDLSVGSVYAFAPIVYGLCQTGFGMPEWLALVLALGGSAGIGLVNGLITLKFRIPSFITTLGMLFIVSGTSYLVTSGHPVLLVSSTPITTFLGGTIGSSPFSMQFAWGLILCIVFAFVLGQTRYGNWSQAAGGRAGVARALGVPVTRIKLINFVACSTLAGFAGMTALAHFTAATPDYGSDLNLLAIVAAVLGGTSLFGVTGSVVGTLVGALILASLQAGLVLIGAPGSGYTVFVGLILIIAVIANTQYEALSQRVGLRRG